MGNMAENRSDPALDSSALIAALQAPDSDPQTPQLTFTPHRKEYPAPMEGYLITAIRPAPQVKPQLASAPWFTDNMAMVHAIVAAHRKPEPVSPLRVVDALVSIPELRGNIACTPEGVFVTAAAMQEWAARLEGNGNVSAEKQAILDTLPRPEGHGR